MSEGDHTVGLRERKRLAAMRRIQEVAFDLFEREGFGAVTIERIAAEAEVSPSSVYRYFKTKEQLVLWDEYDPVWIEQFFEEIKTRPPLESLRRAAEALIIGPLTTDEEYVRRRTKLIMEEPSIEAASALALYEAAELIGNTLSEALGREHGDLDVQLLSHALVGAVTGAIHHWYESGFATSLGSVLQRAMDALDRGFRIPE
ncbi:MAG: TetR family transcriptional regulator [Demequinaceae bacterium]|nr:TetR family transcriptional regulator [Demequinaceae bacterium]